MHMLTLPQNVKFGSEQTQNLEQSIRFLNGRQSYSISKGRFKKLYHKHVYEKTTRGHGHLCLAASWHFMLNYSGSP